MASKATTNGTTGRIVWNGVVWDDFIGKCSEVEETGLYRMKSVVGFWLDMDTQEGTVRKCWVLNEPQRFDTLNDRRKVEDIFRSLKNKARADFAARGWTWRGEIGFIGEELKP